jgi:hypothetical protein
METKKFLVTMDAVFHGERLAVGDTVELTEEQYRQRGPQGDGHCGPLPVKPSAK